MREDSVDPTRGIVFDIETIRHPDLRKWLGTDEKVARLEGLPVEDLLEVAQRNEIAMGKMVNLEPIYNKVKAHFEDQYRKAALKQYGAQICTIAAKNVVGAVDDLAVIREGGTLAEQTGYQPPIVWTADDKWSERDIIAKFLKYIFEEDTHIMLIGFNIRGTAPGRKGFDIPMLRARCAVLELPWPTQLPRNLSEDRHHDRHLFDICDVFGEGSCDSWLRMCQLPVKTAVGSDVQNMTPQERAEYCANDVELERLLAGLVMQTQPPRISDMLWSNDPNED